MSYLKNSQYTLRETGMGGDSNNNNTTTTNTGGSMGMGSDSNNTTTTNTDGGSNKPPKASGDQWLASFAALLSGSSDVIDSISGVANGEGQQYNNTQPGSNNTNTTSNPVNPLWVGLGIGSVILLIVGLLIYSNKNGNSSKPSSPSN